jgi:hypothetical protein
MTDEEKTFGLKAMTYETSATVQEQGRVLLAGVPFEPGTRVEVTITPVQNGAGQSDDGLTVRNPFETAL